MSNQFVLEMPKMGPSTGERVALGLAATAMLATSVVGMLNLITAPDTPSWFAAVVVTAGAAILILSTALFLLTLRAKRLSAVQSFLDKDVRKLGYTPLEPIDAHQNKFRILLRDNTGPALWDVSLRRNTILCTKSA